MALKSAKNAGLEVPPETFDKASQYLWNMYGEWHDEKKNETKRGFGYKKPGVDFGPTAIGVLCQQFMGHADDPRVKNALKYLHAQRVNWPDILFLSNERLHFLGNKKIEGAPDLVVEILSPSNSPKEMGYKKVLYEMCGVREYWVINYDKKTLAQYENVDGEFFMRSIFQKTDTLTSLCIKDFETPMSELFE